MKKRTIVAPALRTADFSKEGKLAYWKQILPLGQVHYTTKAGKRATLNFDEAYLTDLANAFHAKVLDQTPFVLANADNAHTMDPERFRGEVADVRLAKPGENPGLWAKIVFPTKEAAKAVLTNPSLGVSARIREGLETTDGKVVPRAMIHVLGTMDPQVTGMAPWVPAVDLSFDPADNILDLSGETYEGAPVAKDTTKKPAEQTPQVPDPATLTDEQLDAMSEEELEALLSEYAPGILASINAEVNDSDEDESDEDEEDEEIVDETELEPALSAKTTQDIELANQRAAAAEERANEALTRMAAAEFAKYKTEQMQKGVPAWVIDLAAPVLNRPDNMVIDLSNDGSETLDVADIVRKLAEGYQGTVDLSRERGHSGVGDDGTDPDKDVLDLWESQFGI